MLYPVKMDLSLSLPPFIRVTQPSAMRIGLQLASFSHNKGNQNATIEICYSNENLSTVPHVLLSFSSVSLQIINNKLILISKKQVLRYYTVYPSPSPSVSLCPSLSLSLSVCLYLCLSVSLCVCVCVSLSVSVSVCLSLCLSLSLCVSLSSTLSHQGPANMFNRQLHQCQLQGVRIEVHIYYMVTKNQIATHIATF